MILHLKDKESFIGPLININKYKFGPLIKSKKKKIEENYVERKIKRLMKRL